MKLHTLRRTGGIAAAVLALSVSVAACSSEDSADDTGSTADESSDTGEASPSEDASSDEGGEAGATDVFGDACSEIPSSGAGSLDGMVQDPVATAASNNPLLETLVTAVGAVNGLGDTLNGAEALTVFAPTNDAFAAIPTKTLNGLVKEAKADKSGTNSALYTVLAHHVLGANNAPDAVVGEQDTLAGDTLTIDGDTDGMTVTDASGTEANVLCGNIQTANATVYVIDAVMTGPLA